jgi:hypothetical protein
MQHRLRSPDLTGKNLFPSTRALIEARIASEDDGEQPEIGASAALAALSFSAERFCAKSARPMRQVIVLPHRSKPADLAPMKKTRAGRGEVNLRR